MTIQYENSFGKLAGALSKAQSVMGGVRKDKQGASFKNGGGYKYADLAGVFDVVREPFAANGLSISQPIGILDNGRMVVRTLLMHVSGECIESKMLLPDGLKPQDLGACVTYFRRYSLMSIAGLPAEDDDGLSAQKATSVELISPTDLVKLRQLLTTIPEYRARVMDQLHREMQITDLKDLPASLASTLINRATQESTKAAKAQVVNSWL